MRQISHVCEASHRVLHFCKLKWPVQPWSAHILVQDVRGGVAEGDVLELQHGRR